MSLISYVLNLAPNASKESGGNLDTISAKTTSINTVTGAQADSAYAGSGNATVVSALKGIYSKSAEGALESGGNLDSIATDATALAIVAGAQTDTAYAGSGNTGIIGALKGIFNKADARSWNLSSSDDSVAITASALPLPTGAATDSSVQSLISAVKATINLAGSVWFDPSANPVVYYVRRESVNEGTGTYTVTWEHPDGTSATPTVANLQAVSNATNVQTETLVYTATASGTGYSSGDILIHTTGIDLGQSTATVAYSFWLNANTTSILASTPTGGTFVQNVQAVTVSNAFALESGGNLAAVATASGTASDAAYAGSGSSTIISALKGIYHALVSTPAVSVSNLPSNQTVSGTVAVSNGFASETGGNLDTINTSTAAVSTAAGTKADAAYVGSGSSSIVGILKGIYSKSATGAVETGGNLATIATETTAIATATGVQADTSYSGTGSAGVISVLKGIYDKVSATTAVSGSVSVSNFPSNTAQETGGNLAAVATATGAQSDTAYAGSGSTGIIGALKGIYAKLAGTLTVSVSNSFALDSSSQSILTQTTATAGAAGTTADAAYSGTGNSTIVAALKGVYAKLAGTLAVSVASLPLPTGAASDTSVQSVVTETTAIANASGTTADAAYAGSGTSTIIAALKGIYSKVAGTLAISASSLPLPTGAATDTTLQSINTSVQAVTSAINASVQISGTVWFDPTTSTPTYYVRREKDTSGGTVTISWENLDGTSATPTVANLQSVSNSKDIANSTIVYTGTASGTGYSSGDVLVHAFGVDSRTAPVSIAYSFWLNATTGAILSSAPTNITQAVQAVSGTVTANIGTTNGLALAANQPAVNADGGSLAHVTNFPSTQTVSGTVSVTGVAQESGGNLASIATSSTAIKTATGTTADSAYAGSGSASLVSLLKGVYAALTSTISVYVSNPTTNPSLESGGNLDSISASNTVIKTTAGTTADAAYTGSGSASIVAVLKGVYSKLAGTLAISASALPLPTGAAADTSVQSVVTQTTAVATASGTTADSVYAGSGNASIVSVLKGIYAKVAPGALESGGNLASVATSNTAISTATGTTADAAWTSGSGSIVSLLKAIAAITTRVNVTKTDVSGSITVGGTAQQLTAANTSRIGYEIQNTSSGVLYINDVGGSATTAATAGNGSIQLNPGDYWSPTNGVPTSAISIIGTVTGQTFVARIW